MAEERRNGEPCTSFEVHGSDGRFLSKDLTGKKFNHLTALYPLKERLRGNIVWHCKCDCKDGTEVDVPTYALVSGRTKSCGCAMRLDITGKRFGYLEALYPTNKRSSNTVVWHCKCHKCGRYADISLMSLRNGDAVTCGCQRSDRTKEVNTKFWTEDEKHAAKIFHGMKSRCYNPNNPEYKNYGMRGIKICDEWLSDIRKFVEWAVTHGYRQDLSIDRIDVNGPYAPWNCRWANSQEQANNTRRNRKLTVNGITANVDEWEKLINLKGHVRYRLSQYGEKCAVDYIKGKVSGMSEIQPSKPKSPFAYIHGEYVPPGLDGDDAFVAFLKNLDTGETVMQIAENPKVKIWVTKPEARTYTAKREWSSKRDCDEYTTRFKDIGETIWNALNMNPACPRWRHMKYVNKRDQMSSPYVYGADLDLGARLKYNLFKSNGNRKPLEFKTGFLDIETDVNGISNGIILITFVNWDGNTYVGILKEFFGDHSEQEVHDMWWNKVEPAFHNALEPDKAKPAYEKAPPVKLHTKVFEHELDLIKWIFDCIHQCRPDFVTIWNIGYDIPFILDRIVFRGGNPADILCSPDVPKKYRVCKFKKDTSGEHIVDNWSWLHLTDYTRYIDAMCMYGRIRKVQAREPSYQLNAICDKELGTGKLEFNDNADHHIMQKEHKVEYTVYNIVDVQLLRVLELKNNDVRTMMMLIGDSGPEDFSKQSVQLKNTFYVELDPKGGIPGSVGHRLDSPWDKYITNKGGQVLDPTRTKGTGVSILIEFDGESYVHKLVFDMDVRSMYPYTMRLLNCTRETRLCTILYIRPSPTKVPLKRPVNITIEQIDAIPEIAKALEIYNDESLKMEKRIEAMRFMSEKVQDVLYSCIYTKSNAVPVCEKHFGLPGYSEMDKIIQQQLQEEGLVAV